MPPVLTIYGIRPRPHCFAHIARPLISLIVAWSRFYSRDLPSLRHGRLTPIKQSLSLRAERQWPDNRKMYALKLHIPVDPLAIFGILGGPAVPRGVRGARTRDLGAAEGPWRFTERYKKEWNGPSRSNSFPTSLTQHPVQLTMPGGPSASKDGGFGGRIGPLTLFMAGFAAFAGFLFGYDTGTIK